MENSNNLKKTKSLIFCLIISFVIVVVCIIIGVLIRNALLVEVTLDGKTERQLPDGICSAISICAPVCLSALVLGFAINFAGSVIYKRKIKKMSRVVSEMNMFLTSKRNDVESTVRTYTSKLVRTILISDLLCSLYFVCCLMLNICLAITFYNGSLYLIMVGVFALLISRIIARVKKTKAQIISDIKTQLNPEEYPVIYSLVRKAAEKLGITKKLSVCILAGDFNLSVLTDHEQIIIVIGASALLIYSEQELYNVFLHEFGHECSSSSKDKRIIGYSIFLNSEKNWLDFVGNLFFSLPDGKFAFNYMIYDYASSVRNERKADEYMAKYGDKEIAASALLKLKYYDLYNWEQGSYDGDFNLFESEKLEKEHIITYSVKMFKDRLELREDFWRELVDKEIISRIASHPTISMRLETLGVSDYKLVWEKSEEYVKETEKAIGIIQQLICDDVEKTGYDKISESNYLRPQRQIKEWEEKGKPLIVDRYSDIISDLCSLLRYTEAAQLAKRAVDELPAASSAYGLFYYGQYLLRCYSTEGLDYLYRAFAENRNSIEQGMSTVGQFCCIMGLQDELDRYRERGMVLAQEDIDFAGEVSLLNPKDKLSSEYLEGDMMRELKELLATIDDGSIAQVYIVRKQITESFTCSPVIVRFKKDAQDESADEIMHRIFSYLDTVPNDWQFSLFDYDSVKNVPFKKVKDSLIYTGKNDNSGELKE